MSNNTLSLVTEYLDSDDDSVRANVATALAAIGSRESLERLVELALKDPAEGVRARAQEEIKGLDEESVARLSDLLTSQLDDKSSRRRVYALLGRLRSDGTAVAPIRRSLWARIADANACPSLASPESRWRPRWGAIGAGLLGSILGAVLLLIYLNIIVRGLEIVATEESEIMAWAGLFFALVLPFVASQRANPFPLHFDRVAGCMVECAWAAAGSLLLVSIILLPSLIFGSGSFPWREAVWLMVTVGLSAGAVRAGTVAALIRLKSRLLETLLAVYVGAALGVLVLTLSASISIQWLPSGSSSGVGALWLFAIPSLFGLSYVFAKIDKKATYSAPIAGQLAQPVSFGVAGVFTALALFVGLAASDATFRYAANAASPPERLIIGLDAIPSRVSLDVMAEDPETELRFEAWLPSAEIAGGDIPDYLLHLCHEGNAIDDGDDPPEIQEKLRRGGYVLRASTYSDSYQEPWEICSKLTGSGGDTVRRVSADNFFPALLERVVNRGASRRDFSIPPSRRLQILLNAPRWKRSSETIEIGSSVILRIICRLTVNFIDDDGTFQAIESGEFWHDLDSIIAVDDDGPELEQSLSPLDRAETDAGVIRLGSRVTPAGCAAENGQMEIRETSTLNLTVTDVLEPYFLAEETGDEWWPIEWIQYEADGDQSDFHIDKVPIVLLTSKGRIEAGSRVTVANTDGNFTVKSIHEVDDDFVFESNNGERFKIELINSVDEQLKAQPPKSGDINKPGQMPKSPADPGATPPE